MSESIILERLTFNKIFKTRCVLYGERNALVNLQTDIWEKIETVNSKILALEPKKKKRYSGSNVY